MTLQDDDKDLDNVTLKEEEVLTLKDASKKRGEDGSVSDKSGDSKDFAMLFAPGVREALFLNLLLWFMAQIGSGWYLWVVDVAEREGMKEFAVDLMIVARVCVTVSFCLTSYLINKFTDTKLLSFYFIAVGVASLIFSITIT